MKQMIVIRKDLCMRKGKMVSQGAHAAVTIVTTVIASAQRDQTNAGKLRDFKWLDEWLREGQKKIVVGVESEEEMLALLAKAEASHLPACAITDAGHTEFHGVATRTVIAIGPAPDEEVDRITGHLKPL